MLRQIRRAGQAKRFIIFSIGGGLGTLVNLAITVMLTELFHMWYMASYTIGQVVNLFFNFLYHRHITFKKTDRWRKRFVYFTIISLLTILLNMLLVYLITELFKIFYIISIILITILIAVLNYLLNREVVFK